MEIKGKTREVKDYDSKVVGLSEVEVIAINPNLEEYKEELGIDLPEDSKAVEYLGESKEGNTYLRLDIWLKHVKTGRRDKMSFFLENKDKENKDKTKTQYINDIGVCSWADDVNNLPEWFKKRDYRVAKNGEEEFYGFLRTWLGKLDYKDSDTVLSLDWKKLMKNNLSDIKSQINGAYSTSFVALFTVRHVEKDGDVKEYQSVYTKAFLPSFALKFFRLSNYDNPEVVEALANKRDTKPYEKFVLNIKGEYGCKDSYTLKELKEYNPDDFIVSGNEVMVDDNSY
jgi:hypothetical protein